MKKTHSILLLLLAAILSPPRMFAETQVVQMMEGEIRGGFTLPVGSFHESSADVSLVLGGVAEQPHFIHCRYGRLQLPAGQEDQSLCRHCIRCGLQRCGGRQTLPRQRHIHAHLSARGSGVPLPYKAYD